MLSDKLWWDSSEEHSYFLGVGVSSPRPEVKLSEVKREIIDCGLGERREVRAMEKGMSLISRDLQGETLLFKLSCVAQGFFPAKRAFCPFCHICARALSPKINIPQATQAKINIFCVEFQGLSDAILAF